jgi:hypothetical protein
VTPVFGEFLGPAGEHIAAAVSFRGELAYSAQCGVVRQLDRLVATMTHYLADLPLPDALDPARKPQRDAGGRAAPSRLALDRAARSLHPAAAGAAEADDGDTHPVVRHLAAAADYLAIGRDLLHTHFADNPDGPQSPTSYWAPVITSAPVTDALLSELAGQMQNLAAWIAKIPATRRVSPGVPTSALLALRQAEPWLQLATASIQAAHRDRYPSAGRGLLDAIPVNAPPPRPLLSADESVAQLCERIPVTAERLRHAAMAFATSARWSPSATSLSWRRDALASAITGHASELVLRALAERADQARLQPAFGTQLRTAAGHMARAWKSWRDITSQWDVVTTGSPRGTGLTPVAAEIGDLALRAGRLAYSSPHWTPNRGDTAVMRDPADLAQAQGDIISVLAAVHQAGDAISRVAATDQQAVIAAAAENRVYVPVRLLSDKYDIPRPYTPAPREHTDALLAAYDTAAKAASCVATALDDLAAAVDAPSSLLAATRQVSPVIQRELAAQHDQRPAARPPISAAVPGRTEHALRELDIRDPAMLLRAAVIDQAARDLISEATAKANSRSTVTIPLCWTALGDRQLPGGPARTASQDAPLMLQTMQASGQPRGVPAAPASRRPELRSSRGGRTAR